MKETIRDSCYEVFQDYMDALHALHNALANPRNLLYNAEDWLIENDEPVTIISLAERADYMLNIKYNNLSLEAKKLGITIPFLEDLMVDAKESVYYTSDVMCS